MSLLLHRFHNIFNIAIESYTYLQQNVCGYILSLAQFGDGGGADARYTPEILPIHAFVDQELPQPVISYSHIRLRLLYYVVKKAETTFRQPFGEGDNIGSCCCIVQIRQIFGVLNDNQLSLLLVVHEIAEESGTHTFRRRIRYALVKTKKGRVNDEEARIIFAMVGKIMPEGERTSSHIKHSFYYISSKGEKSTFLLMEFM